MDTTGSRIRQIRQREGLSQQAFAARLGVTRGAVGNWERNQGIKADNIRTVSETFDVSFDWIANGRGELGPATASAPAQRAIPASDLVGARDFPVFAAAMGGDGHLIVTFDQVETVKRPSILEGVRNAYALLISGDSMRPAFNHGDMALVHPGLPVARDKVHIFYDHPPFGAPGEIEAMVKNLLSWTEKKWHLEQYNPAKTFDVDRVDWPTAHRVVGRYDAR